MCGIHQRFLRQVLQLLGWHANKMICSWCWCNTVHVRREVIHMLLNGWSQPSRKSLCHAVRNPYAYHPSSHVQSPWWQWWGVVLSMVKLPLLVSLLAVWAEMYWSWVALWLLPHTRFINRNVTVQSPARTRSKQPERGSTTSYYILPRRMYYSILHTIGIGSTTWQWILY